MKTFLTMIVVASAALAGHFASVCSRTMFGDTTAPDSCKREPAGAESSAPDKLILHEWGTFTSFSGSNGVPVGFQPDNSDLPRFVYSHAGDPHWKADRLRVKGTVSMETPVMYFYTDREVDASIRVDFPKGWITEWFPHAATAPDDIIRATSPSQPRADVKEGETIRWKARLLPGGSERFPREKAANSYYHARETDAVPLQVLFDLPDEHPGETVRGGGMFQREKFLFYRGVGIFPPPMTVQTMGAGKVRVVNAAKGKVTGMVLVVVRNGQIGFKVLHDLESGAETLATLPEATASSEELGAELIRGLVAAGLYDREAQAMVKTWDHAWFREEGTRLLYIVPRTRTDELLPLTLAPQPTEVVRVLVGRHDFLTPEQEIMADKQVAWLQANPAARAAAGVELKKFGRFSEEARQMAEQRLNAKKQR